MLKEKVSRTVLILLLISITTLAVNIQPVKADNSWVWVRDTVTGSYGEAVVGTGKALYIARGTNFYRYLPTDDSWVELTSPPSPDGTAFKTGTSLAWDSGDYIYALYGAATGDSRRWFYRYSISSDSWETLANTTVDQGEGNAITWVSIDNCIYATIGGEQRPTYFMRYDPSTNSWSDAPADPPAGMGDGASLVWTGGEYLYALRGEFLETEALYDFWRYRLTDNAWTAMADIPALPHSGGTGGVGDGGSLLYAGFWLPSQEDYIYALSGNQAHPDGIPDNRTYRYTISTNSWERLTDLPFGVGYYVGCRLGYAEGHIYAWQGAPSTWTGGGDDLAKYRLAWIVDDDGPADFHTIQEAINAASSGDTIFVYNGIYYENLVVNKSVSIIGESMATTFIDGNRTAEAVIINANNTLLSGFTIQSSDPFIVAVRLENVSHTTIANNTITNSFSGLAVAFSDFNTIAGNNITKNTFKDAFVNSSNNILKDNTMEGLYISNSINNTLVGNTIGSFMLSYSPETTLRNNGFSVFGVYGETLSHFIQDIDSSNTVNRKPIYYWVNRENDEVPSDAGYVALINCVNITVRGLNFENNFQSVMMFSTNNSRILNNNITNINEGVWISSSSNNTIYGNIMANNSVSIQLISECSNNNIHGNNITANGLGILLVRSSGNRIFHNNFVSNVHQVNSYKSANTWDYGYPSGGNYWSDYTGADVDADAIGDIPRSIDENNTDSYPLIAPFSTFDAGTWNGKKYNVNVVSNSTASNFQLNTTLGIISLNVTGVEGTTGFCRITIPNIIVQDLWQGNYTVLLNGELWPFRNWTDATNTYIYLNYTHSEHQIIIVPEFPSATILPLFMVLAMLAVVFAKRKIPRKLET